MSHWYTVAKVQDVPEGTPIQVEAEGRVLALFCLQGQFYALRDECTHAKAPLSEGHQKGHRVKCPWHAAEFDIRTGQSLGEFGYNDVRSFKTRVLGDDVQVEI